MDFKPKNREWVKNAAIVFLAALTVLTFFSNTIMNHSLPEAATAYVTNGTITAKVRGSGKVVASGRHEVKAKEMRTIRAVMVKAGQEVNTGDVLFVLGEGDSTELEAAEDTLRQLRLNYQSEALSGPIANYSAQQNALAVAKDEYNNAKSVFDIIEAKYKGSSETDPQIQSELDRINATIKDLEAQIAATEEKYRSVERASIEQYGEKYEQDVKDLNYYEGLREVELTIRAVDDQVNSALDPGTETAPVSNDFPDGPDASSPPLGGENTANGSSYDEIIKALRIEILELQKRLPVIDGIMYSNLSEYDKKVGEQIAELQSARDDYIVMLDQLDKGDPRYKAEYEIARRNLQDAQSALVSAQAALDIAYANDSRSQAQISLRLQDLAQQIKRQEDKIREMSGDYENQITASVSGVVDSISCTAGDTVLKDTLLCTIEVPDMGYTLSFTATNDQAQRLRVGDTATVSNFYWGQEVIATLASIRNDPKNPQNNKLLTFDLTGDVSSGSELTISVGSKSANYDIIIPNSAIRNDANGSFVYAVEAKNSPLGNRYIAKRVKIDVLAADDENSAVTGGLNNGDYVITSSSAPINNGDQVRMADSGT